MLETFIASLKDEKLVITRSLKKDDLDELYNAVHRIHGACCYCGVPRLKAISQHLDAMMRKGEISKMDSNFDELINAIDEILSWDEEHEIAALFS
jgi:two-component system sensor histidine kinase BarA